MSNKGTIRSTIRRTNRSTNSILITCSATSDCLRRTSSSIFAKSSICWASFRSSRELVRCRMNSRESHHRAGRDPDMFFTWCAAASLQPAVWRCRRVLSGWRQHGQWRRLHCCW